MPSKEELRARLTGLVSEHLALKPDAVTRYVESRPVERQPWRKRPSLIDKALSEELAAFERAKKKPL